MDVLLAFLDVGQGDCTIAVDRSVPAALVIDCPAGRSTEVLLLLAAEAVSEIRLALITHSDWDHLGGVFELVKKFVVRELRFNLDTLLAGAPVDSRLRAALLAFSGLEDEGVELRPIYARDAGSVGAITWVALTPTHGRLAEAQARGARNASSAIVRIAAGDLTALVAGDADGVAWRRLLDEGIDLHSLILRLPHHGGPMHSGAGRAGIGELLDAVGAHYHVISVGTNNRYGHPALSTLQELQRRSTRARLICTEVNAICLGRAALPRQQARSLPEVCQTNTGFRRNACPCAGTIRFELNDLGLAVRPSLAEHAVVTDALENPMSRV